MQGFRRIATVRAAVLRNSARSQHSGVDVAGHAQVAHATYPANTGNAGPAQAAAAVNSASIPSAGPVAGVGSAEKESSGGNEGFENDAARWQQAVQELGEIKTSGPLVEWFLQYFPRATYQHWFASAAHHNVQSLVQDMAMQVCCEGCTHISTTAMVAKQPVDLNEVHDVVSLVRLLAFDYRCNVPPFVRHAVVELLLALPLSARCAALHRDLSVLAYLVDEFARSGAVGNRLPAQLASSLATAMQLVARDLGAERQRAQELDLAVRKETERVTSFGANQSRMRQLEHSQSAGQSPHEGDPRVKRIQFQRREKISKLRLSQLHTQHQQQMQREQRLAGGVAVTVGVFNAMKAHVADHVVLGDALQELIAHAPAHHYSVHFLSEVLDMFPADPRNITGWPLRAWALEHLSLVDTSLAVRMCKFLDAGGKVRQKEIGALRRYLSYSCMPYCAEASSIDAPLRPFVADLYLRLINVEPTCEHNEHIEYALRNVLCRLHQLPEGVVAHSGLTRASLDSFLLTRVVKCGVDAQLCHLLFAVAAGFPVTVDDHSFSVADQLTLVEAMLAHHKELKPLQRDAAREREAAIMHWTHRWLAEVNANIEKRITTGLFGFSSRQIDRIEKILAYTGHSDLPENLLANIAALRSNVARGDEGLKMDEALESGTIDESMFRRVQVAFCPSSTSESTTPRLVRLVECLSTTYGNLSSSTQEMAKLYLESAVTLLHLVPSLDAFETAVSMDAPVELHWFHDALRDEALRRVKSGSADIMAALSLFNFPESYSDSSKGNAYIRAVLEHLDRTAVGASPGQRSMVLSAQSYRRITDAALFNFWSASCRFSRVGRPSELLAMRLPVASLQLVSDVLGSQYLFLQTASASDRAILDRIHTLLLSACQHHLLLNSLGQQHSADGVPTELLAKFAGLLWRRPLRAADVADIITCIPESPDARPSLALMVGALHLPIPPLLTKDADPATGGAEQQQPSRTSVQEREQLHSAELAYNQLRRHEKRHGLRSKPKQPAAAKPVTMLRQLQQEQKAQHELQELLVQQQAQEAESGRVAQAINSSLLELPVWWCLAKDALLNGTELHTGSLSVLTENPERCRLLAMSLRNHPSHVHRLCAVQLHYILEQLHGFKLFSDTILERIIGDDLFLDMERETMQVSDMMARVFGAHITRPFSLDGMAGLPVANAYTVADSNQTLPLESDEKHLPATGVAHLHDNLASELVFRKNPEPAWPARSARRIVVLAATEACTLSPEHSHCAGQLSVWVRLLQLKGYEPKVISHKHRFASNIAVSSLAGPILDKNTSVVHDFK